MAGDIESLLDRKVQALKVGQCVGSMRTLREGGVALTQGSAPTLIVTGHLDPEFRQEKQLQDWAVMTVVMGFGCMCGDPADLGSPASPSCRALELSHAFQSPGLSVGGRVCSWVGCRSWWGGDGVEAPTGGEGWSPCSAQI